MHTYIAIIQLTFLGEVERPKLTQCEFDMRRNAKKLRRLGHVPRRSDQRCFLLVIAAKPSDSAAISGDHAADPLRGICPFAESPGRLRLLGT
uniref:DUF1330 domain-containing protein n=1 Tax=Steinernema glaseri TaxID=37863 RepID=A0A1I7ZG22_9BILA